MTLCLYSFFFPLELSSCQIFSFLFSLIFHLRFLISSYFYSLSSFHASVGNVAKAMWILGVRSPLPTILTEVFQGFSQFQQTNAGMSPQVMDLYFPIFPLLIALFCEWWFRSQNSLDLAYSLQMLESLYWTTEVRCKERVNNIKRVHVEKSELAYE